MAFTFSSQNRGNVQSVVWSGGTTGDYGPAWRRSDYTDKCVQIKGDFGSGATVSLWGSNEENPVLTDDTDWFQLTDTTETALSVTSATAAQILQNPKWIRPKVAGGTSPSIKVLIEATKGY